MPNTAKHARICIIGAGAAGLSAAYFLKQRGYQNVVVLEKNGRVGGLCCSITYKSRCFDLGANYLTPAYKQVLQLAREVGAELYSEGPGQVYDPFASQPDKPVFKSILSAVMQGTDPVTFMAAIARFYWERSQLDSILAVPGFAGISLHPDLTQPFARWLAEKDLSCLSTLFELPITNMGYGTLDEIPTAYALKYMTLDTFTTLVTYGADLPLGWPKRFVEGFQRLWERISWGLEVHCNVTVQSVRRGATIQVQFTEQEQILDQSDLQQKTEEFDYLILACPLTPDVLTPFLDLSETEAGLFQQIQLNPYSLTTYQLPNFKMPTPVTNVVPMNPVGNPWFIGQQFLDNDLVAFYTRLPGDADPMDWADNTARENRKQEVIRGIQATLRNLGVPLPEQYYTYDEWPYFPHVTSEVMQGGFYDRLEALQGQRKTFYVGGLFNFELVETIVEYSKALVEQNF